MLTKFGLLYLSVSLLFLTYIHCECSELRSVVVLFRHGSRAPRKMYQSDPYIHRIKEIWPHGLSQLTNKGKQQQYELGKYYRQRYSDFIPEKYDPAFVRVLSSNKDRCLMSAAVNLAGLFPPKDEQIWNRDILWQPIPIHTAPIEQDLIINNIKFCRKYDVLYKELLNSDYYLKFMQEKKFVFDYLSKHVGENLTTLDDVTYFHDTMFIEDYFNLTIPGWATKMYPRETLPLLTKVYVLRTNNTALARLKSGPLVDYIATFFENVISDPVNAQKLLMLSIHDSTMSHLLNTLKVFDDTWVEYASTVMFELRRRNNTEFLNVFFKNSTTLREIQFPECEFNCGFDKFKNIIQSVRLSAEDWEKECVNV